MAETCRSCHDPLVLTLDPEESGDEGETVPDDLLLPCGCHFHWQCLLDESSTVVASLTCPSCNGYLPSSPAAASSSSSSSSTPAPAPSSTSQQILAHYTNEGGVDPSLDIYPTLLEESFLGAHPEARPARAFHTLVAEGDVQGMVELLTSLSSSSSDDAAGPSSPSHPATRPTAAPPPPSAPHHLLLWRDPLNGGRTALHVALEARQEEAVWLILWLGSGAAREAFPEAVVRVAEGTLGLPRRSSGEDGEKGGGGLPLEEDVRFVRDDGGRTPADVCLELGPPWSRLVEGGFFI